MDHVVVPLGGDHAHAVGALVHDLAAALDLDESRVTSQPPHITLVGFDGVGRSEVETRVAAIAGTAASFPVRAHGFGFFVGNTERSLALFVPVVRDEPLSRLQAQVRRSLEAAGASISGQHAADVWTPHVTLLDRCLTPAHLGTAAERLAGHTHPSWHIPVDSLAILGPGLGPSTPATTFPFPGGSGGVP